MAETEGNGELENLRVEHRQMRSLLHLLEELTSGAVRSGSHRDLFDRAFPALFRCLPFDVGVAVMLEQNLDLYIAARTGDAALVGEHLIARVRASLAKLMSVSFDTTDVVVKGESCDLPDDGRSSGDGLAHAAHAFIATSDRTAGALLLHRAGPAFSEGESRMLAVVARQVSLLLDGIRTRENISRLAETDDLTGVWNRRHLRRVLNQEIERARTFSIPLSILVYDIDDFKQINDRFGHGIGDVVLSELCGAVQNSLRPTDVHARHGGDEFVVLLPHTDLAGARSVAERLLAEVSELTVAADEEGAIRCSISAGVVELQRDGETAETLLRRADEQLYRSKRSGKNRYTA